MAEKGDKAAEAADAPAEESKTAESNIPTGPEEKDKPLEHWPNPP